VSWRQYDAATSAELDNALVSGKTKVQLTSGWFTGKDYYVDLNSLTQVNRQTHASRTVRKQGIADNSDNSLSSFNPKSGGGNGTWEWKSDSGWQAFDQTTAALLESAYNSGKSSVTLSHGFFGGSGGPYVVDFFSMTQQSSTGKMRTVRRI